MKNQKITSAAGALRSVAFDLQSAETRRHMSDDEENECDRITDDLYALAEDLDELAEGEDDDEDDEE